jgi:hypothetical protein
MRRSERADVAARHAADASGEMNNGSTASELLGQEDFMAHRRFHRTTPGVPIRNGLKIQATTGCSFRRTAFDCSSWRVMWSAEG